MLSVIREAWYMEKMLTWVIVVSLEGRMFPVEVSYLRAPCVDYVEAAIQTVFDIHMKVR